MNIPCHRSPQDNYTNTWQPPFPLHSPPLPDLSIDRNTGAIHGGPPISEAAMFHTTVSGLGSAAGKANLYSYLNRLMF